MLNWLSKDGKAHKTQIVLGLLVDKSRNPISCQIYRGNTYEGGTMIDALDQMQRSRIMDDKSSKSFYIRSKITDEQQVIIDRLKLIVPNDSNLQNTVNQYFIK